MQIVSWNIQAGLGADGVVDLSRIASVIARLADPDVICLQEVARFVPGIGGGGDDVEDLLAHYPGWTAVFGAAIDRRPADPDPGAPRAQFGNLVLLRHPPVQVFCHALPQPADPTTKHMPRQATEVVVDRHGEPLRIVTTHLEFHSEPQRDAQVDRLLSVQREIRDAHARPARSPQQGPYAAVARPQSTVLCGDFNFGSDSAAYRTLAAADDVGQPPFLDAWITANPQTPHAPTCGVHDHVQWPQGAHCRDFFFCTPDLEARIEAVRVDTRTDASDHQPVLLELRDDR